MLFSGEEGKANNLLSALRENKIIDKLPLTPLNLSLISILFEEKDFEIPQPYPISTIILTLLLSVVL